MRRLWSFGAMAVSFFGDIARRQFPSDHPTPNTKAGVPSFTVETSIKLPQGLRIKSGHYADVLVEWPSSEENWLLAAVAKNGSFRVVRKRSTEPPLVFCRNCGISGCYAAALWSRTAAGVRWVATQFTGRRASSSSSAGSCMSFPKTHSR